MPRKSGRVTFLADYQSYMGESLSSDAGSCNIGFYLAMQCIL